MENLKIMVDILKVLNESLDEASPDFENLTSKVLNISQEKYMYLLEMMQEEGLIKGVKFTAGKNRAPIMVYTKKMNITFRGLNYLNVKNTD